MAIMNPDWSFIPYHGGGCAQGYSYGFAQAYNACCFPYYSWMIPWPLTPVTNNWSEVTWELNQTGIGSLGDKYLQSSLAAIGDSWFLTLPILIKIGPFCVVLPTTPKIPSTGMGISLNTKSNNWDTFYLLLFDILHNKNTSYLSMGKVLDQLNSAPCTGPYCRIIQLILVIGHTI